MWAVPFCASESWSTWKGEREFSFAVVSLLPDGKNNVECGYLIQGPITMTSHLVGLKPQTLSYFFLASLCSLFLDILWPQMREVTNIIIIIIN